jgi:hypothetical protein
MTEEPTVKGAEPESPPHGPEGKPPPAVTRTRSRRKKILVPVVLAVIGLALLLAGFRAYPRRAEPPVPVAPGLAVSGSSVSPSDYVNRHLGEIFVEVDQVHPDAARLIIQIQLTSVANMPRGERALIGMDNPGGAVMHCSPSCANDSGGSTAVPYVSPNDGTATASFLVKAHSLGVAANGVTAEAAFPQLTFAGTKPAIMRVTYQVPSASSYDWSSYPPYGLTGSRAVWQEPVIPNQGQLFGGSLTVVRIATGINHAAEAHDSNLTLIAGVLFGLGGGALVAAVQEALHD